MACVCSSLLNIRKPTLASRLDGFLFCLSFAPFRPTFLHEIRQLFAARGSQTTTSTHRTLIDLRGRARRDSGVFHRRIPALHSLRNSFSCGGAHGLSFRHCDTSGRGSADCPMIQLRSDLCNFVINLYSFRLKSLQGQFEQSCSLRQVPLPLLSNAKV